MTPESTSETVLLEPVTGKPSTIRLASVASVIVESPELLATPLNDISLAVPDSLALSTNLLPPSTFRMLATIDVLSVDEFIADCRSSRVLLPPSIVMSKLFSPELNDHVPLATVSSSEV